VVVYLWDVWFESVGYGLFWLFFSLNPSSTW
jgi:hypothetical protein